MEAKDNLHSNSNRSDCDFSGLGVGVKVCPHCKKGLALRDYNPKEYKRRKIANAKATAQKAKERGTHLGRYRKYNYRKIVELRSTGLSYRDIAFMIGCSLPVVSRALKYYKEGRL